MTLHAKLSASGSHRWLNCAGSVEAESVCPKGASSKYADEGTKAHGFAEICLTKGLDPSKAIDDNEMAGHVAAYVDYVAEHAFNAQLVRIEQRVDLTPWIPEGFGTCDALIIRGDQLHVIDLKYGKGVAVDAHQNSQGMLYALGAINDFGFAYDINVINIHIHQPRIDNVSVFQIGYDDLMQFGEEVKRKAQAALTPNAPRTAGEKQCRFCCAKATCPALLKTTEEAIMSEFDNLDDNDLKPVNHLTDDQLRQALRHSKLIKSWLDAVESEVEARIMDGKEFKGYKIVSGRSLRQWTNEQDAESKLIELLGDNAHTKKLISVAQAEKVIGKKNLDQIADLICKPEGKPTLVADTDNRQALGSGVSADDFEKIN